MVQGVLCRGQGCGEADSQFEGYEVAMVDGKIAFSAGSTVPTVEDIRVKLAPRELKPETEAESGTAAAALQIGGEGAQKAITATGEAGDGEMSSADGGDIIVKSEPAEESLAVQIAPPPREKAPLLAAVLPGSLFVGDLRLANLKSRLSALQPPIAAEFAGEGILICGPGVHQGEKAKGGSVVAVRKLAEGEIVLEGGIGRTYEVVRKELYKGFARVVAA